MTIKIIKNYIYRNIRAMMNRRVRRGDNIMHIVNIRLRRMGPRFWVSLILMVFFRLAIGRYRAWIGRFRSFPWRSWERQIMKVITRPFSFLRFCCCKLFILQRFGALFFHRIIFGFSLNSFSNCFKLINLKYKYNCYIRSVLLSYI